MSRRPETYLGEALRSLDIAVHDLQVTDYSPSSFGNLVCYANTGIGRLRIVYDRQFEIEPMGEQKSVDAQTIAALTKALEEAKHRSGL